MPLCTNSSLSVRHRLALTSAQLRLFNSWVFCCHFVAAALWQQTIHHLSAKQSVSHAQMKILSPCVSAGKTALSRLSLHYFVRALLANSFRCKQLRSMASEPNALRRHVELKIAACSSAPYLEVSKTGKY